MKLLVSTVDLCNTDIAITIHLHYLVQIVDWVRILLDFLNATLPSDSAASLSRLLLYDIWPNPDFSDRLCAKSPL